MGGVYQFTRSPVIGSTRSLMVMMPSVFWFWFCTMAMSMRFFCISCSAFLAGVLGLNVWTSDFMRSLIGGQVSLV